MFCKNCGKEIPEDSVFCSFCGTSQREVSKKPEENPDQQQQAPQPQQKKSSKNSGCLWIFLLVIGIVIFSQLSDQLGIGGSKSESKKEPEKKIYAKIRVEDNKLVIKNNSGFDWTPRTGYSGKGKILFEINDSYKKEYAAPLGDGLTLRIPLSYFTKKDGARFNPLTHTVKKVTIWCEEGITTYGW